MKTLLRAPLVAIGLSAAALVHCGSDKGDASGPDDPADTGASVSGDDAAIGQETGGPGSDAGSGADAGGPELDAAIVVNAQLLYPGGSISLVVSAVIGGGVLTEAFVQFASRRSRRRLGLAGGSADDEQEAVEVSNKVDPL